MHTEDQRMFMEIFNTLTHRLSDLEQRERSEIAGAVPRSTRAALGAAGQVGRVRFVTDLTHPSGGIGYLVVDDGTLWRRVSDNAAV